MIHRLTLISLAVSAALFAQETGTVSGTVFDATTGQPVRQAQISIEGQPDKKAAGDSDGRYKLDLPAGKYTIRFSAPEYTDTIVDAVDVTGGNVVEASTVMTNKSAVTSVDVVETIGAVAANAGAALVERKLASSVSDSISSEEIRNTVASDAAGALEKVTGVSVVDGGYVYVRGLGERYSATMLNNSILPTTEPEKRVVPLDLFPASLIDSIKILKTYSADLPGEFSGGLVQLQTIEFPTQKTLTASVSYGFNTVTTFNRFGSFAGGGRDWTGFGTSSQGLPSVIPDDKRLIVGNFSDQEFQQFGRAFSPNYESRPIASIRPTQTYSVVGGNTFGRVGIVGALTFTNSPQRTPEARRFLVNSGAGTPQVFSDYPTFNSDNESIRLGAVLNVAFRLTPNNKIVIRNTATRDTDKESRMFEGLNGGTNNYIRDTRLRWTERGLLSTSVEGEHLVSRLSNSLFHWQFTWSGSTRDEPDLREVIYGRDEGASVDRFLNLPESGMRFFSKLQDRVYEPQADWSRPFYFGGIGGVVKAGFRGTIRSRDFNSRRFRYFPVRAQTLDFNLPPNELFSADNIRPDGFVMREITRGTDSYDASMNIYGGYTVVDLSLGGRWRAQFGVRVEDADIRVNTIDPLIPGGIPAAANLYNRDYLPGINLTYALSPRQNLRLGYGRTVNRPDFRELSPFEFTNVVGGYSTVGNPDLLRATIDNFDVRWEWFLGGNQVLAASYFYKKFTDPIEQIYRPTASELRQSFLNVAGANNQGFELEVRRGLGVVSRKLSAFALQANFTFVNSDVSIPVDRFPQLTSRNRPMVGQSRFIYNAVAEWAKPKWRSSARFYANSVSRRITDVGTFQLPDVYQERSVFLDFVYQLSLSETGKYKVRLTGENLGDNLYRYTQADFVIRQFQLGRTFSVGLSYSFF